MNHTIEYVTRTPAGLTTVVTDTSVIDVQHVLDDIRANRATYWAGPSSWDRTRVRAVPFFHSDFLFANWDGSKRNNLHDLVLPPLAAPRKRNAIRAMHDFILGRRKR